MPAVRVDDAVLRQMPQPEMERHGRRAQVFVEPLIGLEQHVLHDVAGIDPAGQHGIGRMPITRRNGSRNSPSRRSTAAASRCGAVEHFVGLVGVGHMR